MESLAIKEYCDIVDVSFVLHPIVFDLYHFTATEVIRKVRITPGNVLEVCSAAPPVLFQKFYRRMRQSENWCCSVTKWKFDQFASQTSFS